MTLFRIGANGGRRGLREFAPATRSAFRDLSSRAAERGSTAAGMTASTIEDVERHVTIRRFVAQRARNAVLCVVLLAGCTQARGAKAVDPALLFERGLTFEQFVTRLSAQRELWHRNASRAHIRPDLIERLRRVGDGLRVLVIAADWCGDSANTVPYIAMAASSAHVELRIVDRATGEPLMRQHRSPDGRAVTPTVVLLRNGRDVGAWVERPRALESVFLSMASSPERQKQFAERQAWYDADGGMTTVTEVVALAERTAATK
jgi:hypothetical protein